MQGAKGSLSAAHLAELAEALQARQSVVHGDPRGVLDLLRHSLSLEGAAGKGRAKKGAAEDHRHVMTFIFLLT